MSIIPFGTQPLTAVNSDKGSTSGPITVDRIVQLYHQRKNRLAGVHGKMGIIRDQYNNNVRVPLPELDKSEVPGVANLISQGVDQMAMRISSTIPSITVPPVRPGIERSENLARIRRLAMYGWWQANRFDRKQRKRAKELVGYAASAVIIRPDFKRQIPQWQLADPFCTFPAPMVDPDDICPPDAILAYRRSLSWLTEHFPQKARALELGKDPSPDTELEVLEYIDGDVHVLVAVGRPREQASSNPLYGGRDSGSPGLPFVELERFPNRVGRCTLVYATRPSLEFPISQFDGMPAVYKMQARAMALWMLASERNIFPDTWVIDRPNSTSSEIVQYPDGRAGIAGHIHDGDIKTVTPASNPQVVELLQMLEAAQRQSSGLSSQLGGDQPSGIRTGRAGEQALSATIDYWIQEGQATLEDSYVEELKLAVKIDKAYFGNVTKSFYISRFKTNVDYIPNRDFENDNVNVDFPIAGSDANNIPIGIGQRLGLEEMSLETARVLDPWIEDPEEEGRRLTSESVNKAFMASIDQAVAGGQVGPTELARFVELVETGRMDPYKAWQKLHDETQQQQAQQAQPPEQGGPMPGAPESMPGLAAPGQQGGALGQAQQGMPPPGPAAGVSQPGPGLANLHDLLGALHGGAPPTPAGR